MAENPVCYRLQTETRDEFKAWREEKGFTADEGLRDLLSRVGRRFAERQQKEEMEHGVEAD